MIPTSAQHQPVAKFLSNSLVAKVPRANLTVIGRPNVESHHRKNNMVVVDQLVMLDFQISVICHHMKAIVKKPSNSAQNAIRFLKPAVS